MTGAPRRRTVRAAALVLLAFGCSFRATAARSAPAFVDITWMSISNIYYELGPLKILTDGYITRLPESAFSGGRSGLAHTDRPFVPDVAAVTRVLNAMGGPSSVNLLLSGHSHFDHAFDTAVWSKLTGARIIGPQTTCFQAEARRFQPSVAGSSKAGRRSRSAKASRFAS